MRIALLGDMALIGRYDRTIDPSVNQRIEIVRKLTRGCDCVIGNLESPLTTINKTVACKGVYLRSDPINAETLKYMGVTHVTLANNHTYDYGKKGADETINTLKKAGIKYVGLNNTPAIVEKDGNSIAIDGFCCLSANALNYGKKFGQVKMLSYENMEDFFRFSENSHCLPIASVHFGIEGVHYPAEEHIKLFRMLARNHDYILHGNHPHAIQGFEQYRGALLIYAQGNLCFDETPVNSINTIPKEMPEERKCYVSIIEIENNRIVDHKEIGLSDLETGILHEDSSVDRDLRDYVSTLSNTMDCIQYKRNNEITTQFTTAKVRNIRFYLDRLNYKYIGAFINGKIHSKRYKKVIGKYKREQYT